MNRKTLLWTLLGAAGAVAAAVIIGLLAYQAGLHHAAGNGFAFRDGMRAYRIGTLADGRGYPVAGTLLLFLIGGALGAAAMYAWHYAGSRTPARVPVDQTVTAAAEWQRFSDWHRYAHETATAAPTAASASTAQPVATQDPGPADAQQTDRPADAPTGDAPKADAPTADASSTADGPEAPDPDRETTD